MTKTYLDAFYNEKHDVYMVGGRMMYPQLFKARAMKGEAEDKARFGTTLFIPATADITALKKGAADAATAKFGANNKSKLNSPFKKTEDFPKFADMAEEFPVFIRTTAYPDSWNPAARIVGPDAKRVDDESQVYGGRWARVAVKFKGYDQAGNKGVRVELVNVQLMDHDDPIEVSQAKAEDMFAPVDVKGGDSADGLWS